MSPDENLIFLRKRHVRFFQRCLQILPYSVASYDTSRMTVLFFAISGLDLLNALDQIQENDRLNIIEWIYSLQVIPSKGMEGGFKGGTSLSITFSSNGKEQSYETLNELDCGHIAMTYTALATLIILGDDLSKVDRKAVMDHVASLQCLDGSFYSTSGGSENDMRFVYCAATICYILKDFSVLNIEAVAKYIVNSKSFEGGLGQGPQQEAHGGSTFCGIAALYLMNKLDALSQKQKDALIRSLVFKQDSVEGGLKGRPNKPADTCYSFWIGASLKLLGGYQYVNHEALLQFVYNTQDPITGGLGKYADAHPDGLHTYLGISGLALMDHKLNELDIRPVDPSLNISQRALKHLHYLHKSWLSSS